MDCPGQPGSSTEAVSKCTCRRCGWSWTSRSRSPVLPRACARCRSAYWQTAPTSARGNTPDKPKWQAQRDFVEERKRVRRLARLRTGAAELGFRLVPVDNPITRTAVLERQPPVAMPPYSVRFAEPERTERPYVAPPPPSAAPAWRKSWGSS
jgi:hypothetical protein